MMKLCLRNEFAQHALLPLAATLPKIDDLQHFRSAAKKLAFLSTFDSEKRTRWVTRSNVCQCLGISNTHFSVVVDILEYMTASSPSSPASSDRADLFALIAALFAHVYWRQAQKVDTMDVWQPSNLSDASAAATSEPVTSPRSARRQALGAGNGHVKPPRQIAAHVLGQHAKLERMLVEFLVRHAEELLHLLADDVVSQTATASASNARITAHEFDRLALLLQPDAVSTSEPGYVVAAKCLPISPATGLFEGSAMPTIQELVVWMAAGNVRESNIAAVSEGSAPSSPVLQAGLQGAGAAPSAPGTQPVLPQVDLQDCTDILALNHSTMVKSALDVPSGRARVMGCHDSVVYLLAPLAHLTVSDCTDCTVVLGPVGVTLCIEHCDRMQVMAPSARITVHSCHDCVLHLATNRAPLCIGDNRCVQLAPYNTQYAALRKHLQDVGVRTDLNLWNMFIEIGKEARRSHPERSSSTSPHKPDLHESAPPVSTMPPSELLPFLIPFQGDSAPLCGGPPRRSRSSKSMASSSASSHTADRNDLASSLSSSVVPRSVIIPDLFQLPPEYEAALGHKVQAVTGIRTAIKKAVLEEPRKAELQAVIQAHFKDWLVQSGLMRQVYDLARMERSSAASEAQASSATNGSPNAARGSG